MNALPSDIPAAIFVVIHVAPLEKSYMPVVLARATRVAVKHAHHGEAFRMGQVYVAPPDFHLLVGPDRRIHLGRGPRENGFRPAVDPLFRTAAFYYGPRVIGI